MPLSQCRKGETGKVQTSRHYFIFISLKRLVGEEDESIKVMIQLLISMISPSFPSAILIQFTKSGL